MLGGALVFSRGSKSERHLRKKINPAVTHSAVADPANSRHLKKSLEARHLPGDPRGTAYLDSALLLALFILVNQTQKIYLFGSKELAS